MEKKKKYQFLFFYTDSDECGETKEYSAISIKTACRKFHNWRENTRNERPFDVLDYEVRLGKEFINISEIEIIKKYLN